MTELVWIIGLLALGYPLVVLSVLRLVRPARLEMATLGAQLLDDEGISEDTRHRVQRMLDDAFDWSALIGLVAGFPGAVLRASPAPGLATPQLAGLDTPFGRRFAHLHALSLMAANPFFACLLALELAVALPLVRSRTVIREVLNELSTGTGRA